MEAPRILAVDDEEEQIKYLREFLRDYDIAVDGITDPLTVLDHLREQNEYALVIIDVNLGARKDGVDLGQDIRKHIGRKPILFVSAGISTQTLSKIRRFSLEGGIDYMEKGKFQPEELFNTCVSLIKETAYAAGLDEMKGNLRKFKNEFAEVKGGIGNIFLELKALPKTIPNCSELHAAVVKEATGKAIGVSIKKMEAKIDDALQPVPLAVRIGSALKPEHIKAKLTPDVAINKVRESLVWKVAKYFLMVIFGGLCIFWGTMWNKAEHADAGVKELQIKHKQAIDTMQAQTTEFRQIKVLLSKPHNRWTTHP